VNGKKGIEKEAKEKRGRQTRREMVEETHSPRISVLQIPMTKCFFHYAVFLPAVKVLCANCEEFAFFKLSRPAYISFQSQQCTGQSGQKRRRRLI